MSARSLRVGGPRWLAAVVVVAGLAVGVPSAAAEPLPDVETFLGQLNTAADASGAFAAGTTLVHELRYYATPSLLTLTETVNADRSATMTLTSTVSRVDIACTTETTCWEAAPGKYRDSAWHPLPADAVVVLNGFPGEPFGLFIDTDAATYDVTAPTDRPGTTVFSVIVHVDAPNPFDITYAVTVTPGRMDLAVTRSDRTTPVWTESYAATATPVAVAAPDPTTVGRPGSWTGWGYVVMRRNAPADSAVPA